jgi:hypothetical protein
LKDVEDALQRLDNLTQEEARMAAAEALTITRSIDDKVNDVDERLEGVDEGVQSIGIKVNGIEDQMQIVGGKVEGVDGRVKIVGHKVSLVIQGESSIHCPPDRTSAFYSLRCSGEWSSDSTGVQSSQRPKLFVNSPHFIITDHESLTFLSGNESRKGLRKWIAPPDPSVNYNAASGAHHEGTAAWCTEGDTLADWKTSGSLLWIHGKRTYLVFVPVLSITN